MKIIIPVILLLIGCTNNGGLTFFNSSLDEVDERTFSLDEVKIENDEEDTVITGIYEIMPDNPQSPRYEVAIRFDDDGDVENVTFTLDQNPAKNGDEGTASCTATTCTGVNVDTTNHSISFSSTKLTGTFDGKAWTIQVKGIVNY